jgi:transposase InsO family protein
MPWREVSAMEERREFVRLAMMEGVNRRELCRRFGVSPDIGYKWLARAEAGEDLADRSRRPLTSPSRSAEAVEAAVLSVRDEHPAWGARKIAAVLRRNGVEPPAVSTVHAILGRHGRIDPWPASPGTAWSRFERGAPNELWQMDFKGWVRLADREPLHPLTVVDDHSRYSPCLTACGDQRGETIKPPLVMAFRRYGMPLAFFVDNGAPWGDPRGGEIWTRFAVWLLKLGIEVIHSRPYHPQSRGKVERFHRTLAAELLDLRPFASLDQAQHAFNRWREVYNHDRPHEALDQNVPASAYRPSPRGFPEILPEPQYDIGDIVRSVSTTKAYISFKGRLWSVPKAFCGERLAIRPLNVDGLYGVFFASHKIGSIDLTKPKSVSHVPEQASAMSPV